MKNKSLLKSALTIAGASLAITVATTATNVAVAVPARCDVWLCAPALFPSGCGDARDHFFKRIRKGKNPFPSWGSCTTKPDFSPETRRNAQENNISLSTPEYEQPYDARYKKVVYINNGSKRFQQSYSYSKCPSRSGEIITVKRNGRYEETWLSAICNISWQVDLLPRKGFEAIREYSNQFRDHEGGKTYEDVMEKNFTPKLLRRVRISSGSDR